MNFDRFNPLSSYFERQASIDKLSDKVSEREYTGSELLSDRGYHIGNDRVFSDAAISDWGIEETVSNSSAGYYFQPPPPIGTGGQKVNYLPKQRQEVNSPRNISFSSDTKSFHDYYQHYIEYPIIPNTENFSKFIKHYLKLNLSREFWEKFKYNLIVSNLLDDSMILSKNEQNLNNLLKNDRNFKPMKFVKILNNDGTHLIIIKNYKLQFPKTSINCVILIINLIICLLKQIMNGGKTDSKLHELKMFKILLITATKYIKFKRINLIIQMNKNLNQQNDFLINNFKVNKKIIMNLINLKHLKIFKTLDYELISNLSNAIQFLNLNLINSITAILPLVNGSIFEKYCKFNDVDIDDLELVNQQTDGEDDELQIELIINKVNQFNKLRKILICQLLTVDELSETNYLVLKLFDRFNTNVSLKKLKLSNKLSLLSELFIDHNNVLSTFILIFEKFEKLNNQSNNFDEEDILKLTFNQSLITQDNLNNENLDKLIEKVNKLSTNLRFFKKYNQSTKNNESENQEKLLIFNQFHDELCNIHSLYKSSVNELNHSIETTLNGSENKKTSSNHSSNRNSRNSGEFSLKSFHTRNNSYSNPKRYSLPSSVRYSTKSDAKKMENDTINELEHATHEDYKHSSNGLKLGLLTVLEEDKKHNEPNNITSPNYETYNQTTLDILSRNNNKKSNRFSINSMNSNLSGISELISSKITSFEEMDESSLTKDELKFRLEESLNKIYSLEKEVEQKNKLNMNNENNDNDNDNDTVKSNNEYEINNINENFLNDLNNSLEHRLNK